MEKTTVNKKFIWFIAAVVTALCEIIDFFCATANSHTMRRQDV